MITRKQNRLKNFDYSSNGGYFVTICAKEKENIFGKVKQDDNMLGYNSIILSKQGEIVKNCIEEIEERYLNVSVDKYVIMPNHVHIILLLSSQDGRMISSPTLSVIVGQMKRAASRQSKQSLWQRSFHDHVIRNQNDYDKIWEYIDTNLLKWKDDCFYRD